MGDAKQIIHNYNLLIFNHLSHCNRLIKMVSLSRESIGYKISKIKSIKNLSTSVISNLKTKYATDIKKLSVPFIVPIDAKDIAFIAPTSFINKKSLHIGINYTGTANALYGCINDANDLYSSLKTNYGFKDANMVVMTDTTTNKPTKSNIIREFTKLLQKSQSGDLLFFSYSGHGSKILDNNKNERDNNDQCLVSMDLQYIIDDKIKSIISSHLKKNVTLFAVVDSCFSGSAFDLKYQYLDSLNNNMNDKNTRETKTISQVIMISGCTDKQTSADTYITEANGANGKSCGAMTWALKSALASLTKPTWLELLTTMRTLLKNNSYTQIPQLSSGLPLNLHSKCVLSL